MQVHEIPEHLRPKNEKISFFKDGNSLLEKLSRTPIQVPYMILLPIIAYAMYRGIVVYGEGIISMLAMFFGGVLFWTFFEYFAHRYFFHMEPNNAFKKKFQLILHGLHHQQPTDPGRLVMSPVGSVSIYALTYALFYFTAGAKGIGFQSGFAFGYLAYLFVHYITHMWKKPNNIFGNLWRFHHLHHYKYPNHVFGVSSPLWDYIFGTMPPKEDKQ